MAILLETPLNSIVPDTIRDLQVQYPGAVLKIESASPNPTEGIDEDQFWAIIALLDWEKETSEEILQPAINTLSLFSKEDICHFHDILNEKLFQLDARRFAEHLGSNAYNGHENLHFSVDDFLYSRCGVVAQGRIFYEEVIALPSHIPKEFTFEALLYLPDRAWEAKTGNDDLDYFPPTSYETFSNTAGWPGVKTLTERLRIK